MRRKYVSLSDELMGKRKAFISDKSQDGGDSTTIFIDCSPTRTVTIPFLPYRQMSNLAA